MAALDFRFLVAGTSLAASSSIDDEWFCRGLRSLLKYGTSESELKSVGLRGFVTGNSKLSKFCAGSSKLVTLEL